jgi:hypothetical protein
MKKKISLIFIHHAFTAATLAVVAAFLAFLIYAYLAFSGPLIGDIETAIPPELLSRLEEPRIATTLKSLQTRASLPDMPADLPDPYDAVPFVSPPAP